jgi:perosamine synthetase
MPVVAQVTQILSGLLPAGGAALHEPSFSGNEWEYVKDCLDTGWVSSAGAYVDRMEGMLARITGAGHAIATVSGTAALHTCLMLAGVERDDEVIIPALTFVATANAVAYTGAVPHFADGAETTLGLDPAKLDAHLGAVTEGSDGVCRNKTTGRPIRAVVCMHTFGHPVDLDALVGVCERFNLILIEDAAQSLGSTYKGQHTGTTGRLAALSFNGNKTVTTGGGGAILTNDATLAAAAKHLTTTARTPHPWEMAHDRVGYNCRLPNINAALGCAQLEQLPEFVERKRRLAETYRHAFADTAGLNLFTEPANCHSNYWLNAIVLDKDHAHLRDSILAVTTDAGFQARPAWTPMHQLAMYEDCPRMDLSVTESLAARIINIPSSVVLSA